MKIYLNYYQAKREAERRGLQEAEYGSYGGGIAAEDGQQVSFCVWNKSGDRDDESEIEAYYLFAGSKPEPIGKTSRKWLREWAKKQLGIAVA